MSKHIVGTLEAHINTDYYGNDIPYIDLYDEQTNKVLYDLSLNFHGKKVKITIEEIED